MRLESGVERDSADPPIRVLEAPCCTLEPKASDHLHRRFASHAAKDTMEMKGRQTRVPRETVELERFVEPNRDVVDGPLNGSRVERSCRRFHRGRIYAGADRRRLIRVALFGAPSVIKPS